MAVNPEKPSVKNTLHCPECPAGQGHPKQVTTGQKLVVINMQCLSCGHEWVVQRVSA